MSTVALSRLEKSIDYSFADQSCLEQALTHTSCAQESVDDRPHNERFEFLGDAVLGFVVSAALMRRFPDYTEGQLTRLKAYLVSAAHLEAIARRIALGSFLRLGRGEESSGGREKKALLVDAFEALIAGVYMDGGITAAERFVGRTVLTDEIVERADRQARAENFKSMLQEWLQARKMPPPEYEIETASGPAHRRWFKVSLRVGDLFQTAAEGWTKKAAEQDAAREGLAFFHDRYPDDEENAG
jgi:ribonuclease-3